VINRQAVESRHRAAVDVGRKLQSRSLEPRDHNTLFASCSDIPELLDHIDHLRALVADEIEVYAARCQTTCESVEDQMSTCANEHNRAVIQTYLQAANVARAGQDYRNPNCHKCHDTRGGLMDHRTENCTWNPPAGLFEERPQCIGQDLVQVGWMGPYGIVPGGMDVDPVPTWRPIYMEKQRDHQEPDRSTARSGVQGRMLRREPR
jgi:hypothetical protein